MDFACETFEMEEVLRCALSLTKAETRVFFYFREHDDWHATRDVAETTSLDLSTVQRAVKKLAEKDVLRRYQQNLSNGGYQYVYRTVPQEQIKDCVLDIVHDWLAKLKEELDDV
jgi:predicted transcriptional regulator